MNTKSFQSLLTISKDIKVLAKPLVEYLGVQDFSIARFYKDGSSIFLATHLEFLSYCFNNGKYTVKIPTQPAEKTKLYCPWKQLAQNNQSFSKALSYYDSRFDRGNGFSIVRDFKEYVEIYALATTSRNETADFKFLTEIEPIENFVEHLKFEGKEIIQAAEQAKILPPPSYASLNSHYPSNEKLKQFYSSIGAGRARIVCKDQSNILLTPKESECLRYLAQGKSVKQVAQSMNISPRTVSFHLDKIKLKTGYHYNSDLATCYWQHNSVVGTNF